MDVVLDELWVWGDAALILAPIAAIHAAWWGLIVAVSVWRGWDPGNVSAAWGLAGFVAAWIGIAVGRTEIVGLGIAAVVMTAAWPLTVLYHYAGIGLRAAATTLWRRTVNRRQSEARAEAG